MHGYGKLISPIVSRSDHIEFPKVTNNGDITFHSKKNSTHKGEIKCFTSSWPLQSPLTGWVGLS